MTSCSPEGSSAVCHSQALLMNMNTLIHTHTHRNLQTLNSMLLYRNTGFKNEFHIGNKK